MSSYFGRRGGRLIKALWVPRESTISEVVLDEAEKIWRDLQTQAADWLMLHRRSALGWLRREGLTDFLASESTWRDWIVRTAAKSSIPSAQIAYLKETHRKLLECRDVALESFATAQSTPALKGSPTESPPIDKRNSSPAVIVAQSTSTSIVAEIAMIDKQDPMKIELTCSLPLSAEEIKIYLQGKLDVLKFLRGDENDQTSNHSRQPSSLWGERLSGEGLKKPGFPSGGLLPARSPRNLQLPIPTASQDTISEPAVSPHSVGQWLEEGGGSVSDPETSTKNKKQTVTKIADGTFFIGTPSSAQEILKQTIVENQTLWETESIGSRGGSRSRSNSVSSVGSSASASSGYRLNRARAKNVRRPVSPDYNLEKQETGGFLGWLL